MDRAKIIRDYQASGLTQREFARARGLKLSTLGRWWRTARQDEREAAGDSAVEFQTVAVAPSGEWVVEIQSAGGTSVRIHRDCSTELVEAVLKGTR